MSGAWRRQELAEQARKLLETQAAAIGMLKNIWTELEGLRDQIVADGGKAGDVWDMEDGHVVRLERGAVKDRRGVKTDWLDDHFEDLPADVRRLCDIKETATVDVADLPAPVVFDLKECGVEFKTKHKWPNVGDLEERLPPEIAKQAITEQTREKPVLVFEERGISVGQNDRG